MESAAFYFRAGLARSHATFMTDLSPELNTFLSLLRKNVDKNVNFFASPLNKKGDGSSNRSFMRTGMALISIEISAPTALRRNSMICGTMATGGSCEGDPYQGDPTIGGGQIGNEWGRG